MSVSSTRRNIENNQKEIQRLQKQIADENRKESSSTEKILNTKGNISKYTSESSINSKSREIERYEKDILTSQKKRADLSKKVSEKTIQLHRYEQSLFNEQQKENKKFQADLERKRKQEQKNFQNQIQRISSNETDRQNDLLSRFSATKIERYDKQLDVEYDVFISHASEDKNDLVRPLAENLKQIGFTVWYDEFELKVGDKLRRSIDKGLSNSRFGIVVFSPNFFNKDWTQYELDGLVQKEMSGENKILPLWHKVSKDEVRKFSPSLADTVALNTAMLSIGELVEKLSEVLKKVE